MLIILCDLKHHLFAFVIRHILGKNPSLFGEFAPVLRAIERRAVQKSLTDFEADECGSMNEWLAAAPKAQLAHGIVGCQLSVADLADRSPRVLADGEVIDIGGKRLRYIDTPHVPHGWDAGVIFEETTTTLFCGDLFAHTGNPPALTSSDIIGPAIRREDSVHPTSLGPTTAPTIRKLADLKPALLVTMHGASFCGDAVAALTALSDHYDMRLRAALR